MMHDPAHNERRRSACARRLLAISCSFAVVLSFAPPARAFVCSRVEDEQRNETGPSLSWPIRTIYYALHPAGTETIAGTEERDVLRASFEVWQEADLSTTDPLRRTDIQLVEIAASSDSRAGYDFFHPEANENLLIFYDQDWPHVAEGANTIALTTTTYAPQTGQILDTDIEFNSAAFPFATDGDPTRMDLMNTAVHEIGHLLGLGHSDMDDATMARTAREGEIRKRDLTADDREGIVFKYPEGQPNRTCEEPACVAGGEECGACTRTSSECLAWRACGFCARSTPLTKTGSVIEIDGDDGEGCNCGATPSLTAAAVALLLWRRRRL